MLPYISAIQVEHRNEKKWRNIRLKASTSEVAIFTNVTHIRRHKKEKKNRSNHIYLFWLKVCKNSTMTITTECSPIKTGKRIENKKGKQDELLWLLRPSYLFQNRGG